MQLFSIKDTKAGTFGQPFSSESVPDAMRSVTSMLRAGKNKLADFPADFELWRLSDFDRDLGTFKADPPSPICSVASLVEVPPNGQV